MTGRTTEVAFCVRCRRPLTRKFADDWRDVEGRSLCGMGVYMHSPRPDSIATLRQPPYEPDYEDENGSSHIRPCPSCGAGTDDPCEDTCPMTGTPENTDPEVKPWCDVDACPAVICGGPHHVVRTSMGEEILRLDQQPIGTPEKAEERSSTGLGDSNPPPTAQTPSGGDQ